MAPTEQDVKKWGVVEDFLHSTVYNTHFSDCENMHYDSFSAYSKGLDNSWIFCFTYLRIFMKMFQALLVQISSFTN